MATASPVIDRVRKLLTLAERSGSPAEAALAATRAQELIAEHRLAEADLSIAGGEDVPDERVIEEQIEGEYARRKAQAWRVTLAGVLARSFGCKIYYWQKSSRIQAIGRESDVQTLRYVQGYLSLEIQRLTEIEWAKMKARCDGGELPQPTRWRNSFRLGAVDAVRQKLNPPKPRPAPKQPAITDGLAETPREPEAPVPPSAAQALVLARDARAQAEVNARWKKHFPRSRGGSSGFSHATHGDGYNAGREAGASLDTDRRSRGAIAGAKERLT
jgi:hypothetical protein